jgi:hypothetical protein
MTQLEAEIYDVMTFRWETSLAISEKLKEKGIKTNSGFIAYLHHLEKKQLIESEWDATATPDELLARGGARRRVYRKKSGGTLDGDINSCPSTWLAAATSNPPTIESALQLM